MEHCEKIEHVPVMLQEVLSFFAEEKLHVFCEGTVGLGGHAKAILQAHPEIKKYIAMDRDPEALARAKEVLAPWKDAVQFIHGNFADIDKALLDIGVKQVNGFFLT